VSDSFRKRMDMQRSKLQLAAAVVAIGALTAGGAGGGSSSKSDAGGGSTTTTASGPAPITITAGDYKFEGVPKTMTAGIQNVTFDNKGSVDHELAFVKVKPGTPTEAVFAALEKVFNGEPFPAFLEAATGVANTSAGKTTVAQFNI